MGTRAGGVRSSGTPSIRGIAARVLSSFGCPVGSSGSGSATASPSSDSPAFGSNGVLLGLGAGASLSRVPAAFETAYGGRWPWGFVAFASARPAPVP